MEQGEHAEHDYHVVHRCRYTSCRILPFAETNEYVQEYYSQRQSQCPYSRRLYVVGYRRTYHVGLHYTQALAAREFGIREAFGIEFLKAFEYCLIDHIVHFLAGFLAHELGGYLHLAFGTECLYFRALFFSVFHQYVAQAGRHLFGGHGLVEAYRICASADEIDALIETAHGHCRKRTYHQYGGKYIERILFGYELEIGVHEPVLDDAGRYVQFAAVFQVGFYKQAGNEYGSYQRCDNTYHHRCGKTLDRPFTEGEKYKAREERRDIGVYDRGIGIAVTVADSLLVGLAQAKFLLYTFVYYNIGVHRHTYRKYDTGYTWKRERSAQRGKYAEYEQYVHEYGYIRIESGFAVKEHHPHQYYHECYRERYHTGGNGFLSERRSYYFGLHDTCRGWEFSGLQDVSQVFCFLDIELSRYFRTSSCYHALDAWCGIYVLVQYYGYEIITRRVVFPLLGHLGPYRGAGSVHRHAYSRLAVFVIALIRIVYHIARKGRYALAV